MKSTITDCLIFSSLPQTGSVIYGCQWPFDHSTGLLYLKEQWVSFFPLPSTEGKHIIFYYSNYIKGHINLFCL